MNNWLPNSWKRRAMIAGVLALVVIVALVALMRHARHRSLRPAIALVRQLNDSMVSSLDIHADALIDQYTAIANTPDVLNAVKRMDDPEFAASRKTWDATLERTEAHDRLGQWGLVSRTGRIISDPAVFESLPPIADWSLLDSGQTTIQFRPHSRSLHGLVMTPVRDGTRTVGAVVVVTDLPQLARFFDHHANETSAFHSLVDSRGRTIAGGGYRVAGDESADEHPTTPVVVMTPMVESIRRRGRSEDADGYNNDSGQTVIGACQWMPRYNVGVVTELPKREALAGVLPIERGLLWLTLGCMAMATATALRSWLHRSRGSHSHPVHGRSLGNYEIGEPLGTGGMGTVYRARHLGLRRDVAVKVLEGNALSELAVSRFEREVQLTAKLQHPNTIAVYDYGRSDDGAFFYAMELIDGMTLQQLIDGFGAQPPHRVIHLLLQICGSLAEAHGMGLIHRDIKPANILVSRGVGTGDMVKVVDFGLVKDIHSATDITLTRNDSITGTPMYMSPEAVRDAGQSNTQSDLYSIAAVGYTLLAGRPMFEGESSVEICMRQMNDHPTLPEEFLGCPLPSDLQSAIMRGLRKEPADRWLSVEDFASELSQCVDAGKWTLSDSESWWSMASRTEIRPTEGGENNTIAQKTLT